MAERLEPAPGEKWRHYTGTAAYVIDVATHTETGEAMVVYRCERDLERLWARPMAHWMGTVEVEDDTPPPPIRVRPGSKLALDLPRLRKMAAEVASWPLSMREGIEAKQLRTKTVNRFEYLIWEEWVSSG